LVQDWQAQRIHGGFQLNSASYRLKEHVLEAGFREAIKIKVR